MATVKTGKCTGTDRIAPKDDVAHVIGEQTRPLLSLTIPQLLARTVSAYGPREAAVFPEQSRRLSWDELAHEVDAFASGLLALGLARGERIGIWSPNRWEWLIAQYATARIGAILVNINPAYRVYELVVCAHQGWLQSVDPRPSLQDIGL